MHGLYTEGNNLPINVDLLWKCVCFSLWSESESLLLPSRFSHTFSGVFGANVNIENIVKV